MSYYYYHYFFIRRLIWMILVLSLMTSADVMAHVVAAAPEEEGQCSINSSSSSSTCGAVSDYEDIDMDDYVQEEDDYDCGVYMAESSIPNSGWGMYAGNKRFELGESFAPDVCIVVPNILNPPDKNAILKPGDLPICKLWDYTWEHASFPSCPNVIPTDGGDGHVDGVDNNDSYDYDDGEGTTMPSSTSRSTVMLIPSLGSLANSHTRLFNIDTRDNSIQRGMYSVLRQNASAGAFSECQNHRFAATQDIEMGQEIFANYGEKWFDSRYPDVPKFSDYQAVDALLQTWGKLVSSSKIRGNDTTAALDLWNLLSSKVTSKLSSSSNASKHSNSERIQSIMPKTVEEAEAALKHRNGVAGATLSTLRSLPWLKRNGMCVDHLQIQKSVHVPYQNGAFVKRPFRKGQRVTPIPVIPISRQHLQIEIAPSLQQQHGQQFAQQLLLNYCYGHPESSLLMFPYGPAVNLVNHAGAGAAGGINNKQQQQAQANVALRWAPPIHNNDTHFEQSVYELLMSPKTKLVLELYALRDLVNGEEVLLDYGAPFESAWQRHEREWLVRPPIYANEYQPPRDFHEQQPKDPPSHMQARCWIDVDAAKELGTDMDDDDGDDSEGLYPFVELSLPSVDLRKSRPCEILKHNSLTKDDHDDKSYVVSVRHKNKDKVRIKGVPWSAISFVDKPYQGHQYLRQSFRHEIHLSDELFPEAWKDMPVVPPKCKLYMAESSTSSTNSTMMGVYTAQPIAAGDRIHFGDIIVPVVDYQQNHRLRQLYHLPQINKKKNRQVGLEANTTEVRSIIPGLGMLAHSYFYYHQHHPDAGAGVVTNAKIVVEPNQIMTTLHPAHDPGAGASSYYHDAYSFATISLQSGDELIFENVIGDTRTAVAPETGIPSNKGRSMEWLEANGRCLDNLRPGDSTILQAGKGAFATRKISQGAVIAPVPVLPILRGDMELIAEETNKHGKADSHSLGKQLLLNYCYGHPHSSLLLFPYSPIVNYVNHNSTPNAELQWSTLPSHRTDWLNRVPADLSREPNTGIIIELVALRDIKPGEEVFIDYGDEWAQNWRDFENGVLIPLSGEDFVPAWRLNKRMEWLRTVEELKTDPYPFRNVFTACAVGPERRLVDGAATPPVYKWFHQDGILDSTDFFLPCDILERDIRGADLTEVRDRRESISPLKVYYKVRVYEKEGKTTSYFISVPRKAIRFVDEDYSTDLLLQKSFRHEIHLPDEMVSKAWRDI